MGRRDCNKFKQTFNFKMINNQDHLEMLKNISLEQLSTEANESKCNETTAQEEDSMRFDA